MSRPIEWGGGDPKAVPTLGAVLDLGPGDWRYNPTGEPLRICVETVKVDVSQWYGGDWTWITGTAWIAGGDTHYRQVMIRVAAVPAQSRDLTYRPRPATVLPPHPNASQEEGQPR